MKLRRKLIGILLAGTMVMGMGASVMAAPATGEEGSPAGVDIVKNLQMADGITTPNVTFTFDFAKVTSDAPDITDAEIIYTSADKDSDVQNGLAEIQKSTGNILENVTFPHAGIFTYTVTENGTDDEGYGMNYSEASYRMNVYVKNNEAGTGVYVYSVEIRKTTNDDGTDAGNTKVEDPTPDSGEGAGMLFTNVYTSGGGSTDPDADALTISKTVAGEYGDKTKDFTFSVTLNKAATVSGATATYQGKIGAETIDFTTGTPEEIQLHDGESLVFEDLPAGTTYTVAETGAEGYTPSASVVENGGEAVVTNGTEGQNLSVENKLVGTGANSTAFTNTYDVAGDITPTGIIINNLPFILLIVVAAAGIAFYVVSRRRFNR